MTYHPDDFLLLSGLQHFVFCRRQWALIHIEHQWAENFRTVDGMILHEKVHDPDADETRGDLRITRGMAVFSATLGISGECDVVEFHRQDKGIALHGRDGFWQPFPVEYKRGKPKENLSDSLQLCAQAMCLEEMLCCTIPKGALYYGETHHRLAVSFTAQLRQQVSESLLEMHQLYQRGHTPKVRPTKACNACSLKEICVPKLLKKKSAVAYLKAGLEDGA
ncbi:CRISPR-associated protein Cas4 [Bengtsoniella intestinalis]|uniref:CRISPR-associated protein Cas4 n=1 Tax=Bengtsoniella intestinalis TaxID=3073143 RepID=UPI00391F3C7E